MGRLLSKAERVVFWKDDERLGKKYVKLLGIKLTKAHRKVLTHRIRKKIGEMIDLLSVTPLEFVSDPKALVEMIDRNIRKIEDNPNFLDQKSKDDLAVALRCYAYNLESEEAREKRLSEMCEERLKEFREQGIIKPKP